MRIRHIRNRLILASLALIVPFLAWNVLLQISRLHEKLHEAIESQREVAKDIAGICTDFVGDVVSIERTVGSALWSESGNPRPKALAYIEHARRSAPRIVHMAAADPKGAIFASDMSALIGRDVSGHPSVRRIMEGAPWTTSEVFRLQTTDKPMFMITTGIRDGAGKLQGMVVSLIDEEAMRRTFPGAIIGNGQVVIADSKGVVIFTSGCELDWAQRHWPQHSFIRDALAGKQVVVEHFTMPDGRVVMGSVEPISGTGWVVGVFTPREEIVGPVRSQAFTHFPLVMLIIGLTVGMAIYLGNRLSKPALDLARTARVFGEGDLEARSDVRTGDELEFLSDSFNEMAETLQERTSQLNEALESKHREAERASALYTVAQGLVVAMSLSERLEIVARALASICGAKRSAIFLLKGNRLLGVAGWGVAHPDLLSNLSIPMRESVMKAKEAMSTGDPIVVPDASKDPCLDPSLAARFSIKGYLALPLVRRGRAVGLAVLDTPGEYPRFVPATIDTARDLAALAAIAIENAETFEKWLRTAQALQSSLLPTIPERSGGFGFASAYYPAIEIAEMGGDFYDFISLADGRIGLVIADVAGKGLEAAVFTAMGKYTLRAFVSEEHSPARAMTRTNKALAQVEEAWGFVTMFCGLLDPRTGGVVYADAGHPPSLLARASGEVLELPRMDCQPPLGIFEDTEYAEYESDIASGDVLVCYTDGLTEARRDDEPFEVDRLIGVVRDSRHLPPREIAEAIHRAALDFTRGSIQDDIALLVVKREQI
ncbi:MAG TPA: SpoIIE family protein phosphatase [Armatimonadota bacterium]|nr:SpoIIE family protein phosphatase [Armatimonadota bacterium]